MHVVCGGHFWQLSSITSLATETTGGMILVAFRLKHGLRSNLRVPNFKNFSGGAYPQTPRPPSLFILHSCTSLKELLPALINHLTTL